jgi:hypothetical protein
VGRQAHCLHSDYFSKCCLASRIVGEIWISTCTVFLDVTHGHLVFVSAYCVDGIVLFEYEYLKYFSVFVIVGQNMYGSIVLGQ